MAKVLSLASLTLQNQGSWCWWGRGEGWQCSPVHCGPCTHLPTITVNEVVPTHPLQVLVPYWPLERRKKDDPNKMQMPYK